MSLSLPIRCKDHDTFFRGVDFAKCYKKSKESYKYGLTDSKQAFLRAAVHPVLYEVFGAYYDIIILMENNMNKIKLPLRYISEGGYIFDSENKMVLEIRGWGWIQKLKKEEIGKSQSEFQDDLATYIVTLLNKGLLDSSFVK